MFLSIIIPVYNAEKYLAECLDSCLNQDIAPEDYEIICVNDGSKDGSWEILCDYAEKHPNIIAINRENGGVSAARNTGMDAASGDYIWFVDSDDFIQENVLGKMQKEIFASGGTADLLRFEIYEFNNALNDREKSLAKSGTILSNKPFGGGVVTNSLIRRSKITDNKITFRNGLKYGEDLLFVYELNRDEISVKTIETVGYYYRRNDSSATTNVNRRVFDSDLIGASIMKGYYDNEKKQGTATAYTANMLHYFLRNAVITCTREPRKKARKQLKKLKGIGLFPFKRPKECDWDKANITPRDDLFGKLYNYFGLNCTTRVGYAALRFMNGLIAFKQRILN